MTAADLMKELELTPTKDRWIHVQDCSATTGEGLEDGMKLLVDRLVELRQLNEAAELMAPTPSAICRRSSPAPEAKLAINADGTIKISLTPA